MTGAYGNIAAIIIAGLITENLVFERALGLNKAIMRSKNYIGIAMFGLFFCFTTAVGSTLAWGVKLWLSAKSWWYNIRGFAVLVCIVAAYFILIFILGIKRIKSVHAIPMAVAFNSAAFGAVFYAIENQHKYADMLLYCISCSLGVIFAMMLIHSGKERISMSRVPRAFKGIPIVMIYIGILGLAFYGLIGHRLPT